MIKVWVRRSATDKISTITTADSVKRVKPIHKSKWLGENAIYVNECESHPKGSPVVKVATYEFDQAIPGGKFRGEEWACPFCWTILKKAP